MCKNGDSTWVGIILGCFYHVLCISWSIVSLHICNEGMDTAALQAAVSVSGTLYVISTVAITKNGSILNSATIYTTDFKRLIKRYIYTLYSIFVNVLVFRPFPRKLLNFYGSFFNHNAIQKKCNIKYTDELNFFFLFHR